MQSFTKNDMVNRLLNSFRVFVCISIVMSVFNPVMIASASSGAVLSVGTDEVDVGNTSIISISLGNCSNVTNLSFTLSFNESVVIFEDFSKNDSVPGTLVENVQTGSVTFEFTDMGNFNATASDIFDVNFTADGAGSTDLELINVEIFTNEGLISSSVSNGYINVNEVADPVQILAFDPIDDQTVNETKNLNFTVSATGSGTLVYSNDTVLPDGATFESSSQRFDWTPTTGQNGTYHVTFNVTNGTAFNTTDVQISVNPEYIVPTNNPPVLDSIGSRSVSENNTLTITLIANDADSGDTLSFGTNATFGTLNDNVFTWSTDYADSGVYFVEFNVTDGTDVVNETISITVNEVIYTPGKPDSFVNTTGNFWVLHSWSVGSGNETDGYNVSYDGNWYNSSSATFNHTSLSAHDWSNITVYAFNSTSSTLSEGADSRVQISNNDVFIRDVPSTVSVSEMQEIRVDANSTDLDDDTPTFSCNRTDLFTDFDTYTGIGSWTPKHKDAGTHYIKFSVSDEYGSSDSAVMVVTVNEEIYTPGDPESFANTTGNFWVLHDWSDGAGDHTDGYNVSYDGNWYNSSLTSFNHTGLSAHDWSNITVYAYNATSSTLSSGVSVSVQLPNNDIYITNVTSPMSISEGTTVYVDINFTDIDGDTPTFACNNTTLFTDFDQSTGIGSWVTDHDDAGIYYVEFSVSDSYGSTDSEVMEITVTNNNRAPNLGFIPDPEIAENSVLEFTLSATDDDTEDSLVFDAVNKPDGASLNSSTGVFEWTPDYNDSGIYDVQFRVFDGYEYDSQFVEINVTNVNREPQMATLSDVIVAENSTLFIELGAFDPDGDLPTLGKDLEIGSISDGNFTWDVGFEDNGTYDIQFTATDGELGTSQSITITVLNVNRAPTLPYIDSVSVNETELVNITLIAPDPDDDYPLYYFKNVSFGDLDNNVFTWVPTVNDKGIYHINFTVSDGELSNSRVVLIAVNNTNVAPEFSPIGMQNGTEGSEISFTVNATDIDTGDELTYTHSGAPSAAKISSNATAIKFTWTPDFDDSGLYSVQFIVEDELGFSDTMEVPINISNFNRPPEFTTLNPSYTINESETLTINLGANDPDTDQTISVWIKETGNASGTLSGDVYTWDTDYLDNGTYSMEFVISDGIVNTSGTTTITVNDVNAPPEFWYIASKTVKETENLQFTINATDIDGDALNYSSVGTLPNGSIFNNISNVFSWTPTDGQKGTYSVQFNVTDGIDIDYLTVSITVQDTEVASTTATSSGGGGGGGGGSQSTGEKFENIDFKDYTIKSVVKDRETVFGFVKENNSIVSLSFVSAFNGGQTKTIIECLLDTSSLVSGPAPGTVYKNMNIWVGDGKFVPAMVSDAKITFKVDKVWMEENEIDPSSISLCRYSGSWDVLKTSSSGEDNLYVYFVAESPGFSPFAISSLSEGDMAALSTEVEEVSTEETDNEQSMSSVVDDVDPEQANAENQETNKSGFGLPIIIIIGVIAIGFYGYKNRDYYSTVRTKIGNPDGKRYRRVKR